MFVHGLLGGPFKTWRQINRKNTKPDSRRSNDGETEGRRDKGLVGLDTVDNKHVYVKKRNVIRETSDTPSETPHTQCWPRVGWFILMSKVVIVVGSDSSKYRARWL